ncbi:MAG TPA: cyanophycin synthetase, partial [Myxococcota bacterium]
FRSDADVHPEKITTRAGTGSRFELCAPEGRIDVEVAGLGETAVANALAAAAAALAAGAPLADVPKGLARYQPVGGRLETLALPEGGILINDTYNANPQSMEVALRVLADTESGASKAAGIMGNGVQRIAVLGDMGELGEAGSEAHHQTGRLAARLGIDQLFAFGELAEQIAEGARAAGMDPSRIHVGRDWRDVGERVRARLEGCDRVLVKGSRAMRMERIVQHLVSQGEGAGTPETSRARSER